MSFHAQMQLLRARATPTYVIRTRELDHMHFLSFFLYTAACILASIYIAIHIYVRHA